jgi:hypothetical protein
MIIGSIAGKGSHGITNAYLTNKFKRTGIVGKRINIGRSIILGAFRVINPDRNPSRNPETYNPRPGRTILKPK